MKLSLVLLKVVNISCVQLTFHIDALHDGNILCQITQPYCMMISSRSLFRMKLSISISVSYNFISTVILYIIFFQWQRIGLLLILLVYTISKHLLLMFHFLLLNDFRQLIAIITTTPYIILLSCALLPNKMFFIEMFKETQWRDSLSDLKILFGIVSWETAFISWISLMSFFFTNSVPFKMYSAPIFLLLSVFLQCHNHSLV